MLVECLEGGEPLTAEESEEKEQLLEQVSKFVCKLAFQYRSVYIVLILVFCLHRDFHHGAEKILTLSSGHVKNMAEMILQVLLLRWKERQKKKLKDMQKFSKSDTRN